MLLEGVAIALLGADAWTVVEAIAGLGAGVGGFDYGLRRYESGNLIDIRGGCRYGTYIVQSGGYCSR